MFIYGKDSALYLNVASFVFCVQSLASLSSGSLTYQCKRSVKIAMIIAMIIFLTLPLGKQFQVGIV